jgi:hypothetical protein
MSPWLDEARPTMPMCTVDYDLHIRGTQAPSRGLVTPKQRAYLEYLGLPVPLTKVEASRAIDEALQDPDIQVRSEKWSTDRLWMHPTLYGQEIEALRPRRAGALYEFAREEIGDHNPLTKLTKAEAHEAVAWLDEHSPGWDFQIWDGWGVKWDVYRGHFVSAVSTVAPHRIKASWRNDDDARTQMPPPLPRTNAGARVRAKQKGFIVSMFDWMMTGTWIFTKRSSRKAWRVTASVSRWAWACAKPACRRSWESFKPTGRKWWQGFLRFWAKITRP